MIALILQIHVAVTWYMIGLIWFVQVVHYPMFTRVGTASWPAYHVQHMRLTTLVVAPGMLIELLTAGAILSLEPARASNPMFVLATSLILVNWVSTIFVQVPLHQRLSVHPSGELYRRLVVSNWVRTIAWSTRGVLLLLLGNQ